VSKIDVLVVGAGPAGATAALNLAPTRSVLLMDYRPRTVLDSGGSVLIGESLAPAARRLLTDMDLFDSFLKQGHAPCYGNRSVWGGAMPVETDFLRDPDGHGWHLDRAHFEQWLRNIAVCRGARLLASTRLESVKREGDEWTIRFTSPSGFETVRTRFLIDAAGRFAPLGRRLGARRRSEDRIVCSWMHGCARPQGKAAGFTFVESVEQGWWYTAPLPQGKRILAFHTDADLPVARTAQSLLERARAAPELSAVLDESGFRRHGRLHMTVAGGAVLMPCAGTGWLAAGDAAVSFDPLSAQGLLNALFTGLAGAAAADEWLTGDQSALERYAQTIRGIANAYDRHRTQWYRMETRWPEAPFWMRRHQIRSGSPPL
jgi:flavin-dependent dehydrogenase